MQNDAGLRYENYELNEVAIHSQRGPIVHTLDNRVCHTSDAVPENEINDEEMSGSVDNNFDVNDIATQECLFHDILLNNQRGFSAHLVDGESVISSTADPSVKTSAGTVDVWSTYSNTPLRISYSLNDVNRKVG